MPLVFTYGPDAVQGRMFDRIGPTEFLGPAVLDEHELVFDKPNMKNKDEGLANLRAAEGKSVLGSLFELNAKQVEQLEGFFGGYERKSVKVRLREARVGEPEGGEPGGGEPGGGEPEGGEPGRGEPRVGEPAVGAPERSAITWLARRTKAGLVPSQTTLALTRKGLEENEADPGFFEAITGLEVSQ